MGAAALAAGSGKDAESLALRGERQGR